mmetsp:Transcript_117065/g.338388  ORF Transcript_117065/g.338388 Transcript_117065/m.338388 type:complete len:261 (+) Transcript_117065:199-981(+)
MLWGVQVRRAGCRHGPERIGQDDLVRHVGHEEEQRTRWRGPCEWAPAGSDDLQAHCRLRGAGGPHAGALAGARSHRVQRPLEAAAGRTFREAGSPGLDRRIDGRVRPGGGAAHIHRRPGGSGYLGRAAPARDLGAGGRREGADPVLRRAHIRPLRNRCGALHRGLAQGNPEAQCLGGGRHPPATDGGGGSLRHLVVAHLQPRAHDLSRTYGAGWVVLRVIRLRYLGPCEFGGCVHGSRDPRVEHGCVERPGGGLQGLAGA